jgi:hypothetical protein
MTSGEYVKSPASAPELDSVQTGALAGDQLANQPHSKHARLLEHAHAHPMRLDMSFAEEGSAMLARLDEGIYRYTDIAHAGLPPDASNNDRKLFYNVMQMSDRSFGFVTGEFYWKSHDDTPGLSTLERAEAIVDRIAELTENTPHAYLDEVMQQIRQEGHLLTFDTEAFPLVEMVARRHPRLQMHREKLATGEPGPHQIDGVLDCAPDLPATVGECIERLTETHSGVALTGTGWIKQIRGRFLYTPETLDALHKAIAFDPRFTVARDAHNVRARTYILRSSEAKWSVLASKEDYLKAPLWELARRVLDTCATCDLQIKDNLIGKVTRGVNIGERRKREIIQTLLNDPRVLATENPEYVQIAHTPEDAQQYEQLADVVCTAIDTFLSYDTTQVDAKIMERHVRTIATERQITLTAHINHMLRNLVIVDPRVHSKESGTYRLLPPGQIMPPDTKPEKPASPPWRAIVSRLYRE